MVSNQTGKTIDFKRDGDMFVFLMPNEEVKIFVVFKKIESEFVYDKDYTIKVTNVENAAINVLVNRQQSSSAKEDDLITIVCQPGLGYSVEAHNVMSGTEVVESTMESENTFSFIMPANAVDVSADFSEIAYAVKSVGSNMQKAANLVAMTCGTNELKVKETLMESVASQQVLISVTPQEGYRVKSIDVKKAHTMEIPFVHQCRTACGRDSTAQLQLRRFRGAPRVLNWHFQSLERFVLKSKSTYSKV